MPIDLICQYFVATDDLYSPQQSTEMPALVGQGGQVPLLPATGISTAIYPLLSCPPFDIPRTTPRFGPPQQESHGGSISDSSCLVQESSGPEHDSDTPPLTTIIVPSATNDAERPTTLSTEESSWISTFISMVKAKTCHLSRACDLPWMYFDWKWNSLTLGSQKIVDEQPSSTSSRYWSSGTSDPKEWSQEENKTREIPQYVFDYAPYIHLYSGEAYWPCDIADHLIHTTPNLNYTPLQPASEHPTLDDLSNLNRWGRFVYLKSDDNVEDYPEWLGGERNIPASPEESSEGVSYEQSWEEWEDADLEEFDSDEDILRQFSDNEQDEELMPEVARKPTRFHGKVAVGGRSGAPAVLVVVPKPNGIVDAFWFFFYSYNLGNTVFNVRFGNHVGDWEHTLVRFHNGKPKAVFFSEHNFGAAYTYDAVEKIGKRPVGYSATGTHAMYARAGEHPYVLPNGILKDRTDRGPLWDPALNLHAFTYHYLNDTLLASTQTPNAPLDWFYFNGHWGDKIYPLTDSRQYAFLGQYHYVTGPLGPRFKNLGRKNVCQGGDRCVIRNWISGKEVRRWRGVDDGEEVSEADFCRLYPEECKT